MKAVDVVVRARSQIGQKTKYGLGKGGYDPGGIHPFDSKGFCDCSGFTSWTCGESRKTSHPLYVNFNGGWFETSSMYIDATVWKGKGSFELALEGLPGMLLVWPDRKVPGTTRVLQGHVGVIVAVEGGKPTRVVHCSAGNFRATGDAIQETDADMFERHGAVIAKPGWIEFAAAV